jgi:hypothetical protein
MVVHSASQLGSQRGQLLSSGGGMSNEMTKRPSYVHLFCQHGVGVIGSGIHRLKCHIGVLGAANQMLYFDRHLIGETAQFIASDACGRGGECEAHRLVLLGWVT